MTSGHASPANPAIPFRLLKLSSPVQQARLWPHPICIVSLTTKNVARRFWGLAKYRHSVHFALLTFLLTAHIRDLYPLYCYSIPLLSNHLLISARQRGPATFLQHDARFLLFYHAVSCLLQYHKFHKLSTRDDRLFRPRTCRHLMLSNRIICMSALHILCAPHWTDMPPSTCRKSRPPSPDFFLNDHHRPSKQLPSAILAYTR